MKKCGTCKLIKPKSEFNKRSDVRCGLRAICRECCSNYNKKYQIEIIRKTTLEEYNKMFVEQNGCCAICGIHQNEFGKALFIDHNHTTEKIRGLLCRQCNAALGFFKDDIKIIEKAIKYLNEKNG